MSQMAVFTVTWVDFENIMLGKISQMKKVKDHRILCIVEYNTENNK